MNTDRCNEPVLNLPQPLSTRNTEPDGGSESGDQNDVDMASLGSLFDSIGSHIFGFIENGRLYYSHGGKESIFPADKAELKRQCFQQYFLRYLTLQGLLVAPLTKIRRVLDVGTGQGSWAVEFAKNNPEVSVTGVDLAPIQPKWVPPNLTFEVDDLEKPWVFTNKFDYIFCAMMAGSLADWPKFYRQAFDNLTPGGFLEIHDFHFPVRCDDQSMPPNCNLVKWSNLMMEAATNLGLPLDSCVEAQRMMITAGFSEVIQSTFVWPQNGWLEQEKYKFLGKMVENNFIGGIEAMSMALFTRGLGWSKDRVIAFLLLVRCDMRNTNIHAYWHFQVVYGKKL